MIRHQRHRRLHRHRPRALPVHTVALLDHHHLVVHRHHIHLVTQAVGRVVIVVIRGQVIHANNVDVITNENAGTVHQPHRMTALTHDPSIKGKGRV